MTSIQGLLLSVFSGGRDAKKNGDCRRPKMGHRPFGLSILAEIESGALWEEFERSQHWLSIPTVPVFSGLRGLLERRN